MPRQPVRNSGLNIECTPVHKTTSQLLKSTDFRPNLATPPNNSPILVQYIQSCSVPSIQYQANAYGTTETPSICYELTLKAMGPSLLRTPTKRGRFGKKYEPRFSEEPRHHPGTMETTTLKPRTHHRTNETLSDESNPQGADCLQDVNDFHELDTSSDECPPGYFNIDD